MSNVNIQRSATAQSDLDQPDLDQPDYARRFGGVARLYGATGLAKLQAAHVVVVGIGGVGSWAAEALARNGVGCITLVDLDNIAESNVNRQIHALDDNFGKAKVSAMHARILTINPSCNVHEIEDFVTLENASKMLDFQFDCLLDCIDDAIAKAKLAAVCKAVNTPIIMSGSAGGRLDPTRIKAADLSMVTNDKLLAKVRNTLRRDYAFPKASQTKKSSQFNVTCVYSDEPIIKPGMLNEETLCDTNISAQNANAIKVNNHLNQSITGINCAGYGSSVCVTAPMGFAVAQLAINRVLSQNTSL
jgi:tRNA threonylcarbamoyladenosine dehydratase